MLGLFAQIESKASWNCFPFLASHCSAILDEKYVDSIRHRSSVNRPCISCTFTMEDMINSTCGEIRNNQNIFLSQTVVKNF